MEYYSAIKKRNSAVCNNVVDLESIMLSEISQIEKDKYPAITYMWNLKNKTNERM